MSDFTEAESQVLVILARFKRNNEPATFQAMDKLAADKMASFRVDWSEALKKLLADGLIALNDDEYSLTEAGVAGAATANQTSPLHLYFYNEYYRRSEASAAHGEFTERIYGENLCQHGMMDMEQLRSLLEVLQLTPEHRVIELGCGNGFITERISDRTGAYVTGVDLAYDAIERANGRVADKVARLRFEVGNMNALRFAPDSFDAIIAIDTLYFVADLNETLRQMKEMLRPGGQMGIFYDVWSWAVEDESELEPDTSKLAVGLTKLGLEYSVHDFTAAEADHWRRKIEVLRELRSAFEAEGNMFLFNNRMAECESELGTNPGPRYLYHVRG